MDDAKTYDWLPTVCAPKQFPVNLLDGSLVLRNGSTIALPQNVYIAGDWGGIGPVELIDPKNKPLPDSLHIRWFSYRERKTYSGDFSIKDTKLSALFQEGFISPFSGAHVLPKYIIIGMAPGGYISLWAAADGAVYEAGAVKAQQAHTDTQRLIGTLPSIDVYVRNALSGHFAPAQMGPIDADASGDSRKWGDVYRRYFPCGLTITTRASVQSVLIMCFNGERIYRIGNEIEKLPGMAVPASVIIGWEDSRNGKSSSQISFDESEITAAFASFAKDGTSLSFEINTITLGLKVYLRNGGQIFELKKCSFKTF